MGLLGSLSLKGAMKQVNEVLDAVDQIRAVKPSPCRSLKRDSPTGCRGFNNFALTSPSTSHPAHFPDSLFRKRSPRNTCFHLAASGRDSPHRAAAHQHC